MVRFSYYSLLWNQIEFFRDFCICIKIEMKFFFFGILSWNTILHFTHMRLDEQVALQTNFWLIIVEWICLNCVITLYHYQIKIKIIELTKWKAPYRIKLILMTRQNNCKKKHILVRQKKWAKGLNRFTSNCKAIFTLMWKLNRTQLKAWKKKFVDS